MKQPSQWFRCVIACSLFCAFFSVKLFGCMRTLADVKVPPSFRVSVWNDTKTVPGITVEIYNEASSYPEGVKSTPVLRLQTDQDGNAEARDLAPGVYLIQTAGPGLGSAVYAVVATNHSKPSSEIKLEWPYLREGILKSRTLAGDLVSNKPWNPFENIHLELWTAGASLPLAVSDTGPDGHFQFDESRQGIYILRIRGRQKNIKLDYQVEGDVVIELSPSAPDATKISLHLDMTDCGVVYNNCPDSKPVAMASRRIQVLNVPGMAEFPTIKGARYKLLNDHGGLIADGITDKDGIAELPSEPTGKATLIVADSLKATLQQPLNLLPLKAGTPSLAVTLTQIEKCSTARLETHAPQK